MSKRTTVRWFLTIAGLILLSVLGYLLSLCFSPAPQIAAIRVKRDR